MKAHELAAKLLSMPNIEVLVSDYIGPLEISSVQPYTITEDDEENCGNCDGRVGEEVVALHVDT